MSSRPVLQVTDLNKSFKLYPRVRDRLRELLTGRCAHTKFQALRDISFALAPGESMGIIGENGSGKSTLLKIIAGVLAADSGSVVATGPVTGLLELGTGFNPQLSGRQNIYLNGIYLNLTLPQLRSLEESIAEFAEVGSFLDQPLRTWSSGMIMRLGFAIAIHAHPACFVIDEALSVGDASFQQKCFRAMDRYRAQGGSILFVSHDLNAIRVFCDRTLLLAQGRSLWLGDSETAVNRFYEVLAAKGSGESAPTQRGYGTGEVRFTGVRLENGSGDCVGAVLCGQALGVHFQWDAAGPVPAVTFGIAIRDRFGQDIFGTNGALLGQLLNVDGPGGATFFFPTFDLAPGKYSISLAAHSGVTHLDNCYHWWDQALSFEVLEDVSQRFVGLVRLDVTLAPDAGPVPSMG